MLKVKFCQSAAAVACLIASAIGLQAEIVMINGHKAYSDAVLAKVKPGVLARQAAAGLGAGVEAAEISMVPGLVVIRREGQLQALNALTEEQKGAELSRWIADLEATGRFEYVEPDYQLRSYAAPNDQAFANGTLWGLHNFGQLGGVTGADISATNAWDFSVGSTNVIVGVIDSGVRYTHRDLVNQMWVNPDEIPANGADDDNDGFIDNIYGIDPLNNDGDPNDDNDHGTHVAGTIGAAANDGNPHVGVAWNVRIMALKFLGADGFGPTTAAIQCINFGVANGARILNNSWGGGPFQQALLDSIIAARNSGVLFVAAAGNEFNDNDRFPAYPASYRVDNIISVAALDRADRMAVFSNYGKTSVHLGAPGVDIFSTVSTSDTAYDTFQGTSMAAPHVSGVAALVASYIPSATYSDILFRITNGVITLPALAPRTITGGRLNAFRALTRGIDNVIDPLVVNPSAGSQLGMGSTVEFTVAVADGLPITNAIVTGSITPGAAALVFTNAPNTNVYRASYRVPVATDAYPLTLTLNVSAPEKDPLAPQSFNYTAVPRPSNDNLINSVKVPAGGGRFEQSASFATLELLEPQHADLPNVIGSVWYSWSVAPNPLNPGAAIPVIIDTVGSTYDAAIAVYTGSTVSNLTLVAATNDVTSGLTILPQPWLKFMAQPNISYKIAIAENGTNATEQLKVRFEINGEPDNRAPFVDIQQPFSGIVIRTNKVIVSGTAFDPQPNSSGISDVALTVNGKDQVTAEGTTNWVTPFPLLLQPGINMIRAVAFDFAKNQSAEDVINITFQPESAPNDIFARADIAGHFGNLTNGSSPRIVSTETATKEFGEPPHAGNQGGKSVWYYFQPTEDGTLFLSTVDSDFDTLLAVYTGTRVSSLTLLASNDDMANGSKQSELTVGVRGGQGYFVAIDGYDAAYGNAYLHYNFRASTSFSVEVLPAEGGSVTPAGGVFPQGSTVSLTAIPQEGFQFARFEVIESGLSTNANPFQITVNGNVTIRPVFATKQFASDFEQGMNLPFETTKWFIANEPTGVAGNRVLMTLEPRESRNVTNIVSLLVRTEAGLGAFDFGVSSETNYDRLEFYVTYYEGALAGPQNLSAQWSGVIPKSRHQFETRTGLMRLEWRYVKDAAISQNGDWAYIDNLDMRLVTGEVDNNVSASFEQGDIRLAVPLPQGETAIIQASQDLVTWTDVGTVTGNSAGLGMFREGSGSSFRFYRVKP